MIFLDLISCNYKNKSHQCNQHRCDSNHKHDTTMPTPAKTIKPLSAKDQERFLLNVIAGENPADCHDWKLGKTSRGYGVFWLKGKQVRAPRAAYTIAFGEIPDGMFVCHKCDNPSCVNPLHLFLGKTEENMADMTAKGRQMKGDSHYSRTNPEKLARGKNHSRPTAKITEIQVLQIRSLKRSMTNLAIAKMFGLSQAAVSMIVTKRNWSHV